MANDIALQIVSKAVALRVSHSSADAHAILDGAMSDHVGSTPDFSDPDAPGGSHVDHPAPLGKLIFATYGELVNFGDVVPFDINQAGDLNTDQARIWRDLMGWFQRSYMLGEPRAEVARTQWLCGCLAELTRRQREIDPSMLWELEGIADGMWEDAELRCLEPRVAVERELNDKRTPEDMAAIEAAWIIMDAEQAALAASVAELQAEVAIANARERE